MSNTLKIILSIPSFAILIIIPYNFFADVSNETSDLIYNTILFFQILYFVAFFYIAIELWKNKTQSKRDKWIWALSMICCIPPIPTLIYLWFIEPKNNN